MKLASPRRYRFAAGSPQCQFDVIRSGSAGTRRSHCAPYRHLRQTARHVSMLIVAATLAIGSGCARAPQHDGASQIPGTLYLFATGGTPEHGWGRTYLIRGGHVVEVRKDFLAAARESRATFGLTLGAEFPRQKLRLTYNGVEFRSPYNCDSGTAPQIALSPDGKIGACALFTGERLAVFDFRRFPSVRIWVPPKAGRDVDPNATPLGVAFMNNDEVAFLKFRHSCAKTLPRMLIEPTAVYLLNLKTKRIEDIGCASGVIPQNATSPAIIRFGSSSRDPMYSLDGGRTWVHGDLVAVADTEPVTYTGGYYDYTHGRYVGGDTKVAGVRVLRGVYAVKGSWSKY